MVLRNSKITAVKTDICHYNQWESPSTGISEYKRNSCRELAGQEPRREKRKKEEGNQSSKESFYSWQPIWKYKSDLEFEYNFSFIGKGGVVATLACAITLYITSIRALNFSILNGY